MSIKLKNTPPSTASTMAPPMTVPHHSAFRENHILATSTGDSNTVIAIDKEVTKIEFMMSNRLKPEHQCYTQKPELSF